MAKYRTDRIEVHDRTSSPGAWIFAGSTVKGVEFRYKVTDQNHRSRNRWEFLIRVPHDPYGRIEVRPVKTPNDRAFAGLDRRSLTFMRGTRTGYTKFRYCPLALAVPGGGRTKDWVHRNQRQELPVWIRRFGWRLKQKVTVRNTRGTDAKSLVVLVRPDDHVLMIATFLATKAWILKRNFVLH